MMPSNEPEDIDFWMQIYTRCQHMNEESSSIGRSPELVKQQLHTLVETFEHCIDPADQFEEYVVIMLCKEVLAGLEKAS